MTIDPDSLGRAEGAARSLWQGDLLATPTAAVLEARASSLHEDAYALEPVDDEGIWAVGALSITSGWAAIVSQTCDVVREIADFAYLQLMPVVDLSQEEWTGALNGRRGALFALLPAAGFPLAHPAIDCEVSFPVSKAALGDSRVRTINTPMDPAARVLLSNWLMRGVGRHAFPDELENHVLRPLRDKITKATGKTSPGGQLASVLLGVWSSTEWAASVSIIFVIGEHRLHALNRDLDLKRAVDELLAPARSRLGKAQLSVQVVGTATTLPGVSAHDLFVQHRQVDIDQIPVGEFAAKSAIAALAAES